MLLTHRAPLTDLQHAQLHAADEFPVELVTHHVLTPAEVAYVYLRWPAYRVKLAVHQVLNHTQWAGLIMRLQESTPLVPTIPTPVIQAHLEHLTSVSVRYTKTGMRVQREHVFLASYACEDAWLSAHAARWSSQDWLRISRHPRSAAFIAKHGATLVWPEVLMRNALAWEDLAPWTYGWDKVTWELAVQTQPSLPVNIVRAYADALSPQCLAARWLQTAEPWLSAEYGKSWCLLELELTETLNTALLGELVAQQPVLLEHAEMLNLVANAPPRHVRQAWAHLTPDLRAVNHGLTRRWVETHLEDLDIDTLLCHPHLPRLLSRTLHVLLCIQGYDVNGRLNYLKYIEQPTCLDDGGGGCA